MNTSKLLSVTAASALALSLAACGGSSGGDTAASREPELREALAARTSP